MHTFGPSVQKGVSGRDAFEQRADEGVILLEHALGGAPCGGRALIGWPMGYALRRRGSEVEPNAVCGGVRQRSGGTAEHLRSGKGSSGGVGEGSALERSEGAPHRKVTLSVTPSVTPVVWCNALHPSLHV